MATILSTIVTGFGVVLIAWIIHKEYFKPKQERERIRKWLKANYARLYEKLKKAIK